MVQSPCFNKGMKTLTDIKTACQQQSRYAWIGSLSGLIGAGILSTGNPDMAVMGWCAFLVSNIGWIIESTLSRNPTIFIMQLGFVATTVNGLSNSF